MGTSSTDTASGSVAAPSTVIALPGNASRVIRPTTSERTRSWSALDTAANSYWFVKSPKRMNPAASRRAVPRNTGPTWTATGGPDPSTRSRARPTLDRRSMVVTVPVTVTKMDRLLGAWPSASSAGRTAVRRSTAVCGATSQDTLPGLRRIGRGVEDRRHRRERRHGPRLENAETTGEHRDGDRDARPRPRQKARHVTAPAGSGRGRPRPSSRRSERRGRRLASGGRIE